MSGTILHVDMDAFFASVEQLDHPELRGKPVVVGAPPDKRGVVAAASYEAREYGIHSAMPSREAGKRCPHAVFVPSNGKRYSEVSRKVLSILEGFTPLVEQVSIDEAFLDVSGAETLFGSGPEIALKIKDAIRKETGLTASVGVASNKFLAKLASDMDKPDGLTVVPEGSEEILAFLAPLPVGRLWGVGKVTQNTLEKAGLHTVGQLRAAGEERLARILGTHAAEHLCRLARGEDSRELELDVEEKSMSKEHTFPEDCDSVREIERVLLDLVDEVASRLREHGRYASLARLKLRWKGFETITRQKAFAYPCCDDFSLREMALDLFRAEELIKPVRLVGFGVSRFTDGRGEQLELFSVKPHDTERRERLSRAVDTIRGKFGDESMRRGSSGGGEHGRTRTDTD